MLLEVKNPLDMVLNGDIYKEVLLELKKINNISTENDKMRNLLKQLVNLGEVKESGYNESIAKRIQYIKENFNVDKYLHYEEYTFRSGSYKGKDEKVRRKNDEPKFEINPKLYQSIFGEMPSSLETIEEKAFYIYFKLCKILRYDPKYTYANRDYTKERDTAFSAEKLSSLKPGSKVVCCDFARVFARLLNELGDEIEAVAISEGKNEGHWSVGFYTNKMSVRLDATKIERDADDLNNIKIGNIPCGIEPVFPSLQQLMVPNIYLYSDSEIGQTVVKASEAALGKRLTWNMEEAYELNEMRKGDIKQKLDKFIEILHKKDIKGAEALQLFLIYEKFGVWDITRCNLRKCFLIKKVQDKEGSESRLVVVQSKEDPKRRIHVIDLEEMSLTNERLASLNEKLENGELEYENVAYNLQKYESEHEL